MSDFPELLDVEQTSEQLHKKPNTLKKWRCQGIGPTVTRIGRTPYYSKEDIRKFLAQHRESHEEEN